MGGIDHATVFRLLRDGQPIESVMSGWQIGEEALAEQLIRGHRAGLDIDSHWLVSPRDHDRVLERVRSRPDLTAIEIAGEFRGRVSPHFIHVLKIACGDWRGMETRIFNEDGYEAVFLEDLAGAEREILVVSPEIKGAHWRRYLGAFRRLTGRGGEVAFFTPHVSSMIGDDVANAGIVVIEKRTHANLVVIDQRIAWEGSLNFMLPPVGEEHIRRTVGVLVCDEIRERHDLFL